MLDKIKKIIKIKSIQKEVSTMDIKFQSEMVFIWTVIFLLMILMAHFTVMAFHLYPTDEGKQIPKIEAQAYVVYLKNNGELARGITVGDPIPGQQGYFEAEGTAKAKPGYFRFIIWNGKLHLVGIQPPSDYPPSEKECPSPESAVRRFLSANFDTEHQSWIVEEIGEEGGFVRFKIKSYPTWHFLIGVDKNNKIALLTQLP